MINWFEHLYPYTNVHELNLDWIIDRVKMEEESIKNFVGSSVIKYAVPIQWDITRQYERNTVVIDANTGDAYVSIQPVPVGFDLSHTEYWMKVFTLGNQIAVLESQIANNEGNSTRASRDYAVDDLVWVNDLLYKVIAPIATGTLFDVDNNIEQITIEEVLSTIRDNINTLSQGLSDEVAERARVDQEIRERLGKATYDYIVALDGSGDYTSLAAAVSDVPSGSKILVKSGVYNDEVVNCLGKELLISGENKYTTIIRNGYDDYTRAPLNIGKGIINNISFYSTGTTGNTPSYACHIDNDDLMDNSLMFYNCRFQSAHTSAVGIGTRKGCKLVFDTCDMISTSGTTDAFFIHPSGNSAHYSLDQNAYLINCRLQSSAPIVMHLQKYGTNANATILTCTGCTLESSTLNRTNLIWISGNPGDGVVVFNKGAGNNYSPLNYDTWAPDSTVNSGRYLDSVIRTYTKSGNVTAGVQASFSLPADCSTIVRMDGIITSVNTSIAYPLGNHVGGTSDYHEAYFVNTSNTKSCYISSNEDCTYTINIEYVSSSSDYI